MFICIDIYLHILSVFSCFDAMDGGNPSIATSIGGDPSIAASIQGNTVITWLGATLYCDHLAGSHTVLTWLGATL